MNEPQLSACGVYMWAPKEFFKPDGFSIKLVLKDIWQVGESCFYMYCKGWNGLCLACGRQGVTWLCVLGRLQQQLYATSGILLRI